MGDVIATKNLVKNYTLGKESIVRALRGIGFTVRAGEFVAIMGPSGSGKSTLMHILGCLDVPTSGQYVIGGNDTSKMTDNQLANLRNHEIGFVFQSFNLLPRTTAIENVELPLVYHGSRNARKLAMTALERVGLENRMLHRPNELSIGQQQRVAIARALVNDPSLILADEPTGNLDTRSSEEVLALIQSLNREGRTIVLVTHEPDISHHAKRMIRLLDGQIVVDQVIANPLDARTVLTSLPPEETP